MLGTDVQDKLAIVASQDVPDGWSIAYRERHDAAIDYTYADVVIAPPNVNPDTFRFGQPGAYAHISVNASGTYTVGIHSTETGWNLQAGGRVIAYVSAAIAVGVAVGEIQGELRRQARGW